MKETKKYIIRKVIKATSALEAIKLDKTTPVLEVFLDPVQDPVITPIGFKKD